MFIHKTNRPLPTATRFRTVNDLINDLFDDVALPLGGKTEFPYVNIHEDQNNYQIELIAPGFAKEQFHVSVHEGALQVKGTLKTNDCSTERTCTRKEYVFRSFERTFKLPEAVNLDAISANYENGILRLTLPKLDTQKPASRKEISIN